jgi:hypothetical protein
VKETATKKKSEARLRSLSLFGQAALKKRRAVGAAVGEEQRRDGTRESKWRVEATNEIQMNQISVYNGFSQFGVRTESI